MDKGKQPLVLIGLVIVAVLVAGYIGIGPVGLVGISDLKVDSAKLLEEKRKLDVTVQTGRAQVAGLDQIKKERAVLESQLRDLSRKLPSERESAEVLRNVETLAGKSGLTVSEVKRRPVRSQELYAEIPMEIGVAGGYLDLVKFAAQLAQLERLVTLNELDVKRPPPGTPAQAAATPVSGVKALMVAVVFQALPEPKPADAAARPKP